MPLKEFFPYDFIVLGTEIQIGTEKKIEGGIEVNQEKKKDGEKENTEKNHQVSYYIHTNRNVRMPLYFSSRGTCQIKLPQRTKVE